MIACFAGSKLRRASGWETCDHPSLPIRCAHSPSAGSSTASHHGEGVGFVVVSGWAFSHLEVQGTTSEPTPQVPNA
jgi:hypothetical protein